MARMLTCRKCHQKFDAEKVQAFQIGKRSFIHYTCRENEDGEIVPLPQPKEKPVSEEQKIIEYCESIYGKDKTNYAQIKRQIKQYKKEYNYSESGILKCLKYWFEIKHGDISKANGAIGIVPFIYSTAYNYYLNLFLANQANQQIDVAAAANKEKNITIKLRLKEIKKPIFNFWDELEGEEDEEN